MSTSITHGVSTRKKDTSVSTPNVASSGIHFAVGCAPVQMVSGKVNEVLMLNSYEEAVSALGYSDDWKKYGLCEEIYTAFTLYNISPIFVVNVLDPTKHKKTANDNEAKEVADGQIKLPLETIASSVKISEKTAGTDFDVFYDDKNCIVEFLTEAPKTVTVTYDVVDLEAVTKSDIIGGYNVSTHKTTGLELIDSVFPKYTEAPDIILCPNWAHDSEVAAVMSAKAENINAVFEAFAVLDIDTTADGATYYTEAPAWKKKNNFMKKNELVCFPKVKLGDRMFNLSTQLAGSMTATDNDTSLGDGTPCESASNKTLQADSMCLDDGTEVLLDLQAANYLNDNGIITALNFYNGFVSWGNYTAAFPASTDPVDYIYSVSRMFKWVAKTVILSYWGRVDRRMTRRLLDAILQGVNDWLNALTAEEKIIGGRVELLESENTLTALMAGKAKFHIYLTPPTPLQQLDFILEYDTSYLAALLAA